MSNILLTTTSKSYTTDQKPDLTLFEANSIFPYHVSLSNELLTAANFLGILEVNSSEKITFVRVLPIIFYFQSTKGKHRSP